MADQTEAPERVWIDRPKGKTYIHGATHPFEGADSYIHEDVATTLGEIRGTLLQVLDTAKHDSDRVEAEYATSAADSRRYENDRNEIEKVRQWVLSADALAALDRVKAEARKEGMMRAAARAAQLQLTYASSVYEKGYSDGVGDCLNAIRAEERSY